MTRPHLSVGLTLNVPRYEDGEEWPVSYVYESRCKTRALTGGPKLDEGFSQEEFDKAWAQNISDGIKRELEHDPDFFLKIALDVARRARANQFSRRIPMSTYVSTEKK